MEPIQWLIVAVVMFVESVLAAFILGILHGMGVRKGRIEGYRFAKKPWDEELGDVAGSLGDVIQDGDYRQHRIGCDLSFHPPNSPIPEDWQAEIEKCRTVEYRNMPIDEHYDVARREWTLLAQKFVNEIARLEDENADLHTCPDCKENCKQCQCYEEREAGYQRRIAELEGQD